MVAAGAWATDVSHQRALVNGATVGIISGSVTGTYVRIASDLATAFDDGYALRILPVIGKGSVRNIEDLLLLRGIDVAIVQSDVLDFYRRNQLWPGIDDKIGYIAKLYNEEIHLLARADIVSVDDLAGRPVNFDVEGSGTFMTAGIVFDELGIEVDVTTFPQQVALAKLRQQEIDAMLFVGGKPLALITEIGANESLQLLPIPADRVAAAYLPTTLTAESYPALIAPDAPVDTLAVGAVMAAYAWPPGHERQQKVERFVERFFSDFDRLLEPPFHAKWREVDLGAEVPGWRRIAPADARLASRP